MSSHLEEVVIPMDASIRAAMTAIDRGAIEIALVVDSDGRLVGTLTDGDVRRAILKGASLDEPASKYMQQKFTAVGPSANRAEVLDLLRARSLRHIPVLDVKGRLTGLHLLQEIIGGVDRPNCAVIMAGGRGERLRPITDSIPKPMVQVAGRPILERIVLHLVGCGIRNIFIAVNYLGDVIERHFGDGMTHGCRIAYLREQKPLGTGGALSLLPSQPKDPVLVLNGDLLTQFDMGSMLAFHANGNFVATVAVHDYVHTIPYGVLDTDGARIVQMREKPSHSWVVNAGIYVVEPALIRRIPPDTYFPMPALMEECLERSEPVGAFRIAGDWMDIGHASELTRARGESEPV